MSDKAKYPPFSLTPGERTYGRWIAAEYTRVEGTRDEDIGFVEGTILVNVDPITNTILFTMDDRQFSIDRQLLADTIDELWPEQIRHMEWMVEEMERLQRARLDNVR